MERIAERGGEQANRLPSQWDEWVSTSFDGLRKKHLVRELRPIIPTLQAMQVVAPGPVLASWLGHPEGNPHIAAGTAQQQAWGTQGTAGAKAAAQPRQRVVRLFSMNDYLGLSTHPAVCRAVSEAALSMGSGPRSSALVGGYTTLHRDLERDIAGLKGTEACLLFPTGFAANLAAVTSVASSRDAVIFSDELNHASIVDGCRLAARAGAEVRVYRHNDLDHLEVLLMDCPASSRKLVITDSLFSMDGDFADLARLAEMRDRHGFLLAIDEAHATLVVGPRGGGAAEAAGVSQRVDMHIGTLSKAFGAHGGFIACSGRLRALLLNRARSYIFSTALPIPVLAAARAALRASLEEPELREHLWRLVARLGEALGLEAVSPIIPLQVGSEEAALAASAALLAHGFHVPAIRPPTVPPGTCRLRISLSAAHTEADISDLIQALQVTGLIRRPDRSEPWLPGPGDRAIVLPRHPRDPYVPPEDGLTKDGSACGVLFAVLPSPKL